MRRRAWNEKIEIIAGLLDQQLALIERQLQSVHEESAGKDRLVETLKEFRELCLFTREVVSGLSRPRWTMNLWRISNSRRLRT